MKKKILSMAFATIAMVLFAEVWQVSIGFGTIVSVTDTAQEVEIKEKTADVYAKLASLYNAGTSRVYAAVNCANATLFNSAVSSNQVVPIEPSQIFTFQGERITSVWLKTTNGTTEVHIGAY